jgi:hypothetical protein
MQAAFVFISIGFGLVGGVIAGGFARLFAPNHPAMRLPFIDSTWFIVPRRETPRESWRQEKSPVQEWA